MSVNNRNFTITMNDCKDLKWSDIPLKWAVCFNIDCPQADKCLRWQAGRIVPNDVTTACCVTPKALNGGECPLFASTAKVRWARGFCHLYDHVMKSDYTLLRKQITAYLSGKRIYYEYMHGKRCLSPEQQEWIIQQFKERGYGDGVTFDSYEDDYRYPWIV